MNLNHLLLILFTGLLFASCGRSNPNLDSNSGEDILVESRAIDTPEQMGIRDTVYVPIYSSIYSATKDSQFNLTATLSIRNTSLRDTMYVSEIDYYDSDGELVREYIDYALMMAPMSSLEYVIEELDTQGGTGANFIVSWAAENPKIKPLFQGVMISTFGQQGISFLTEGISISQ